MRIRKATLVYAPSFLTATIFISYTLRDYKVDSMLTVSFALLCIWLVSALLTDPAAFAPIIKEKKYMYFFIFVFIRSCMGIPHGGPIIVAKNLGLSLILFSPMLIYDFYSISYKKALSWLKLSILAMYGVLSVLTIEQLNINPNIARAMTSHSQSARGLGIGGGFNLAYTLAILCPLLVILMRAHATKLKPVTLSLMLLFALVVMRSKFAIAVIILGAGLFFAFSLASKASGLATVRNVLVIFFGVGFLLTVMANGEYFGEMIIRSLGDNPDLISSRITDLGYWLTDNDLQHAYSLQLRIVTYKQSLSSFLKSPLIGWDVVYGGRYSDGSNLIGNHSEWFDALARWGIVGGVPYILAFFHAINDRLKSSPGGTYLLPMVLFFVLGFLNPVGFFSMTLLMFFLYPSLTGWTRRCV